MKKIFTLALLVISFNLFAAPPSDSRISITNLSIQQIQVEIDGKRYNNRVNNDENLVLVPAISSGIHAIRIYTVTTIGNDPRPGMTPKKLTLIFQKNFSLKAQYHTDIVINRFGKVTIDELSMNDRNYVDIEGSWNNGNGNNAGGGNNGGWNNGGNNNGGNNNGGGIGSNNGGNNGGWNNGNNGNNPNTGGYDPRYSRAMSDQSFAALKEALVKEKFDNSRLTIAKQVMLQNYFTVDQVKQMIMLFSFDNYKLDLAKTAYKYTVNRPDYFMLYEVFSFSNSKEELANYIKQFKD
jgi:hypothetical protein